jgi:hypothetical protein
MEQVVLEQRKLTYDGGTTVNAANTYTGLTTVSAGSLTYGVNDAISSGAVTVNGSTAILALGTYTDTVGAVTLTAGSITGTGTSSQGRLTSLQWIYNKPNIRNRYCYCKFSGSS